MSLMAPWVLFQNTQPAQWVERLGLSPAPMPFINRRAKTPFSKEIFFIAYDKDQKVIETVEMNSHIASALGGPHRYKVFFLKTFLFAHYVNPAHLRRVLVEFCPRGRLPKIFQQAPEEIFAVGIQLGSLKGPQSFQSRFPCR